MLYYRKQIITEYGGNPMKRLHFTKCRTSLLAVLLAFSVAFVPVPFISDTSSDSAALITTAQAAQKNTKDRFPSKKYQNTVENLLWLHMEINHISPTGKSKTPTLLNPTINSTSSDDAVWPMPM